MSIFLAVLSLPPLRIPHIFLPQRVQAYKFLTPPHPTAFLGLRSLAPGSSGVLLRDTDCWPHPGVSDLLDDFPNGSTSKKSTCKAGDMGDAGSIPGLGRSPGVTTHSSIPAWEIPGTEEPGGLQSMGLQRVR